MKSKSLIKIITLQVSFVLAFLQPVEALPFRPTPSGFANYANQMQWDNGTNAKFRDLYNCRKETGRLETPASKRYAEEADDQVLDWRRTYYAAMASNDKQTRKEAIDQIRYWTEVANKRRSSGGITYESFHCSGFVRLSDPRGNRVCTASLTWDGVHKQIRYGASGCIWK